MASPGASPRGQFASVEEYVDFVGGQRPIKKVRRGWFLVGGVVGLMEIEAAPSLGRVESIGPHSQSPVAHAMK